MSVTIIKSDVLWHACSEDEEALLNAVHSNDVMEVGRLAIKRIEYMARVRIQCREEEKAKYRAEILAESCQGTDA